MILLGKPSFPVVVSLAASADLLPHWTLRKLTVDREPGGFVIDWRADRSGQHLNWVQVRLHLEDSPQAVDAALRKELSTKRYEDLSRSLPPTTSGEVIKRDKSLVMVRVIVSSQSRLLSSDAKAAYAFANTALSLGERMRAGKPQQDFPYMPRFASAPDLKAFSIRQMVMAGSRQSINDGPSLFAKLIQWNFGGGYGKPYINAELYRFGTAKDAERFIGTFGTSRRGPKAQGRWGTSATPFGYTDRRGYDVLRIFYRITDKKTAETDPDAGKLAAAFFEAVR